MKNLDFMLDLETYGDVHDSVIVQIGCVSFDRTTGEVFEKFKINVNPATCEAVGLRKTEGTMDWWAKQSKEARDSISRTPLVSIEQSLLALSMFVGDQEDEREAYDSILWSHATFDPVILGNAYKAVGLIMPFKFWNIRDLRTLVDLAGVNYLSKIRKGVYHDALDDCLFQVEYAVECFDKLRG